MTKEQQDAVGYRIAAHDELCSLRNVPRTDSGDQRQGGGQVSSNTKLIPPKPGDGPEVHKAFWDGVVCFIMCELMQQHRPVLQGFLDAINAMLENDGVRIEMSADSSRLIVVATKDQEVGK